MSKFVVAKLPKSVKKVFIDADSIAYMGAFVVEKTQYKFLNINSGEESPNFDSAKEAATWLANQREIEEILGLEFDDSEWQRLSWKEPKSVGAAIQATKQVLKQWLSNIGDREYQGFLTERGTKKHKDIEGLEHRYQGNRGDALPPTHLDACRDYLLNLPEFSLLKGGFEADSIVIAKAEKLGEKAALMSIDKDLRQAEGTYCIDMTYEDKPLIFFTPKGNVGDIWNCPIKSNAKTKKTVGVGFKFLCYQAVAGDVADNYFGLKGAGQAAVIKALEGKTTYKECLDAIYEMYEKKGDVEYVAWDGSTQRRTPLELMEQHFWLAYQERNKKDDFTFKKYNWEPHMNED